MTTTQTTIGFETNGGTNAFTFDLATKQLTVSGQSIRGTYELTGKADQSAFIAKLWGGTLLSNGNVTEASFGRTAGDTGQMRIVTDGNDIGKTYDVFSGNLNVPGSAVDSGDKKVGAVVDFGPFAVTGSEKYGFANTQEAQKFLAFVNQLKSWGVLDDIM